MAVALAAVAFVVAPMAMPFSAAVTWAFVPMAMPFVEAASTATNGSKLPAMPMPPVLWTVTWLPTAVAFTPLATDCLPKAVASVAVA